MSTANLWSSILKLSNSDISNNLHLFHLKKQPDFLIYRCSMLQFFLIQNAEYIEATPSVISEWEIMTAGTETALQIFPHGLRESPVFVQVEGKAEYGWVFLGIAQFSAQTDDDKDIYSGGMIFMYDVTNVIMFIPHPHNTKSRTKEWVAIYRGIYMYQTRFLKRLIHVTYTILKIFLNNENKKKVYYS